MYYISIIRKSYVDTAISCVHITQCTRLYHEQTMAHKMVLRAEIRMQIRSLNVGGDGLTSPIIQLLQTSLKTESLHAS